VKEQLLHILLLRHGRTASNANGVVQGHLPVPLDELGRRQARRLAARVGEWRPAVQVLISSDLARAMETAEPIAQTTGLTIEPDRAWRERGFGSFEGRSVGEVDTWRLASGETDPPGAESIPSFQARVREGLLTLTRRFEPPQVVAVVTHGGPCLAVLRLFSQAQLPLVGGTAPPEAERIINCSITHLTFNGSAWGIGCANDAAHLDQLTAVDAG
jgi:2,3-bisphosphoglycerate-dependent phosphoglycerate mutase